MTMCHLWRLESVRVKPGGGDCEASAYSFVMRLLDILVVGEAQGLRWRWAWNLVAYPVPPGWYGDDYVGVWIAGLRFGIWDGDFGGG